jgi:polysaccharide pyruvyl transferase WcaK-like protein
MAARMNLKGGARTPIFASAKRDMYEMVSILRACDWMVSSRYHGMVTSMPALVPAVGVTMDERIRNLLHEQGREDLLLTVEDPDLEVKLLLAMETLRSDADGIRSAIGRTVVDNLKRMASMGVFLEQNVHERYLDFPIRGGVRSWEEYLPPLSQTLVRLVEKYESTASVFAAG